MRLRFFYLIFGLGSVSACTSGVAYAKADSLPPKKWQEFLRLDREYNVPGRRGAIVSAENRRVLTVYDFKIAVADFARNELQHWVKDRAAFESHFIDSVTRRFSQIEIGGKAYYRVYVLEGEKDLIAALSQKYGPPGHELRATKLNARTSYLLWDPKRNDESIIIKLQRPGSSNRPILVRTAVINSDIAESSLQEPHSELIKFMPERFGISLIQSNLEFGYVLRSVEGVQTSATHRTEVLPLHGFLGSERIVNAAANLGLTRAEWIRQEYLPKLARFNAELNFHQAIYTSAHTQNLMIEIDPKKGSIESFFFKDLADDLYDPELREARHLPVHTDKIPSDVIWNHVVANHSDDYRVGGNATGFVSQSVLEHERDETLHFGLMGDYLEAYKSEAERISGRPITLSPESRALIEQLKIPPAELVANGLAENVLFPLEAMDPIATEIHDGALANFRKLPSPKAGVPECLEKSLTP